MAREKGGTNAMETILNGGSNFVLRSFYSNEVLYLEFRWLNLRQTGGAGSDSEHRGIFVHI